MAKEEIGQLQVIIGDSKSLLQSGLKYVGKTKALQFFKDAPKLLTARQKLCILINACDTMLSDGKIENAEREFFKRLLAAFGQSEDTFKSYYQVLFLKNERPLDRRQEIKKAEQEIPSEIAKKEKTSAIFDRKFLVETEKSSNEDFKKTDTSKGKDTKASLDKNTLESTISSKMRDNVDTLSKAMESDQGLSTIERNANQADDSPFRDAKKSASGPTINRKFNEDSANASADKVSQAKASGPEISRKSSDGAAGAKIKPAINDSSDGPKISNNILNIRQYLELKGFSINIIMTIVLTVMLHTPALIMTVLIFTQNRKLKPDGMVTIIVTRMDYGNSASIFNRTPGLFNALETHVFFC
jgi:hypothetical protein